MEVIQATVNRKLLSKAQRLFTGTLCGRIIEILQNARRGGATEVHITNCDGQVTVRDNGRGIADFAVLLDLGQSDWDQALEEAEDPAGVGVFCLAPRQVCIRSGHKQVVIAGKGWTGEPVQVLTTEQCVTGTTLVFPDEPWTFETVHKHAVFTGLTVEVDGRQCDREPFVSESAVLHPELGCHIEVRQRDSLRPWHTRWKDRYYADNVLVNFHGQVVAFTCTPVSEHLHFLVDLTSEPTPIGLMLPARTCLVENEAFELLKVVIEKEAYRYIQKRGSHQLTFGEYCRARELGISLPEAEPTFEVGLLTGEPVEPVAVKRPADWPLERCYRLAPDCLAADDDSETNVHLLSALGRFEEPFVVVEISSAYDGYRWAKLPTVKRVEVTAGKELARDCLWAESLVAVESLRITAQTSDGRTFSSAVTMAVRNHVRPGNGHTWIGTDVLVTPQAREQLRSTDLWFHLGGWSDEGDTYETQRRDFQEELDRFWSNLDGPGQYLRCRLLDCLRDLQIDWQRISMESNGKVWITHQDGTAEMFQPPEVSSDP